LHQSHEPRTQEENPQNHLAEPFTEKENQQKQTRKSEQKWRALSHVLAYMLTCGDISEISFMHFCLASTISEWWFFPIDVLSILLPKECNWVSTTLKYLASFIRMQDLEY
jgi:hypothetical protein